MCTSRAQKLNLKKTYFLLRLTDKYAVLFYQQDITTVATTINIFSEQKRFFVFRRLKYVETLNESVVEQSKRILFKA